MVLLGTGKVANHLFDAFKTSTHVKIIQVAGRNKKALHYFNTQGVATSDFEVLAEADIYIIAISDDAINTVSEDLRIKNKLLVHTSGTVDIGALSKNNRAGVFYPLQTFSRERNINFKEVPICIEAETEKDVEVLRSLASSLSDTVYEISSDQRKSLHLAAVFVNNFANHLYAIGDDICREIHIPFSILYPLILETTKKIERLTPKEVQTGPAMRNDLGTMEKHLELLNNRTRADLYALLSKSIRETYKAGQD